MDAQLHTGRLLGTFVFVAATAGFFVFVVEPALAQGTAATSGMELTQPEPTGLLGVSERLEAARALDEAGSRMGRVIYVDVVVDGATGQRVSTGWIVHSPEEGGAAYAKEALMPVTAEDLDAPGSIVILVDPFEKKGSFLKSPGLSEEDDRRISSLMTAKFRRGEYAEGLVKASNELVGRLPAPAVPPEIPRKAGPVQESARERRDLEDLLEDRLRELRSAGAKRSHPSSENSGLAIGLVCAGTVAVLSFLFLFLKNERYHRPDKPEKTAAVHRARRTTEESVAALAPKMLLLAKKEEAVASLLNEVSGEGYREARRLGRETVGLWKRFSDASALIESDPEKALEELRLLPPLVDAALKEQEKAASALAGEDEHRENPTEGESDARARRR